MIVIRSNASVVAAEFAAGAAGSDAAAAAVVTHHSALLQTRVKGRASGRPGPRVVTGDYRRSIARVVEKQGSLVIGRVGTNNPQGRRLEMGFTGTDSLGRYYDQPPYPHFGPAFDEGRDAFLEDLADAAVGLIVKGKGGGLAKGDVS